MRILSNLAETNCRFIQRHCEVRGARLLVLRIDVLMMRLLCNSQCLDNPFLVCLSYLLVFFLKKYGRCKKCFYICL